MDPLAVGNRPLLDLAFEFDHVHLYTHGLRSLHDYLRLQDVMNSLAELTTPDMDIETAKEMMKLAGGDDIPAAGKDDIVDQLISGMGYRIYATRYGKGTHSVLLTSEDHKGSKFIVTGLADKSPHHSQDEECSIYSREHLDLFFAEHGGAQGIAVLAITVEEGGLQKIMSAYEEKHPNLLTGEGIRTFDANGNVVKVFEAYLYYRSDDPGGQPDKGTKLRILERSSPYTDVLPCMEKVHVNKFDGVSGPSYADHWVSNVVNRDCVLGVLRDTLGFTPKVDFNAGIIAAGEAIIESIVTGNNVRDTMTSDKALTDQHQVYFPINTALSDVGHVAVYLHEIGQGVQHLAQRVPDLPSFASYVNRQKEITGRGFHFENIPRSYYGRLTLEDLIDAGISRSVSTSILASLQRSGLVSDTGIVKLDITEKEIVACLDNKAASIAQAEEYVEKRDVILKAVKVGRYITLYKLLGDHISEERYVSIVRNKILVDTKEGDILYQIFTQPILRRFPGAEAPFLEFIQRTCSEKKDQEGNPLPVKAGCGGLGIRNVLTLFLSIELSKAMEGAERARGAGDAVEGERCMKMVEELTNQLNECNPILTELSDVMALEADTLALVQREIGEAREARLKELKEVRELKEKVQQRLKETSDKYRDIMKSIRKS